MNSAPLVSIVTPCIRPQFIGRAVQSVLNQTYQNFEMLVVNDGGEDFAALLEAFDDRRIRYLRHEQRRGRSAARNTAFQNARGKYIAYLDDDDYYYPNHLQMLVEFLENSDYRVAYTDGYQTFETDETGRWEIFRRDLCYSNDFSLDLFLVDNILDTNALMHERACLFKVGFFDQNLPIHEDWDLWLRIAIQYPFFHIRQLTHEYSTRRGGDHARLYWLGEVLSTCLVVQHRYQQWSSPAIQAQQEARRKFLAEGAVNQLYSYPLHRLKASQIPQTTRLIVERSQVHGNGADRERAYQVANALAYRLPEEETVWVSLAKSLRFLGHPEAGLEAIDRALGLRVTKEALVEQLYLSRALDRSTDATTQLRVFQAQFPDMPLPPEYPEPLPYLLPELPPYQEFVADPSGIPSAPHIDRPTLTPQSITFLWQRDRRIRELVDWVEQLAHLYEYLSLDGGTLWECLWANPSNRWVEVGNQLATQGLLKSSLTPQDYCHLREVAAAQVASTTPHPTLTQIYQSLQAVVTDVTSAVAVELQVLANGCYPNPMVLKLLEYVQQRGLKVIILAETDLSADQFAQILQAKGLGDWSDRIFTSSDLGVGKEEGALYQQVADRLGIHPQAMLHIGGDWTLDYQVPSDLKIKATHYPPATPYIDELFERERALLANSGGVSLNSLRVLVSRLDGHIGGDRTPFQCGALLFGSVMARFADWSVEQFQALGIDRVLTLMPEGILLQQLLETAANQRGILLTCIPCYLNLEQEQAPTYLQSLISGIDRVGVLALGSLNCSIPEVVRVIQSLGVTCLGCTLIAGGQEKKGILEGLDVRAYLGFATESIERSGILEGLTACIEPVEEYRETPTGAIEPIWASSPEHREEWERRQLLQEGVLTFQHLWWSVLKGGDGFDLEAIDRQNQVILNRLVQFPIQREAYLFGAFERHQEPVCREVDFQILRMEGAFGLWQNPDVRWPQGVVAIECPNVVHRWAKSGWPLDRMENEGAWSHYRGGLLPYSPQEVQVLADYLWRYKPTTVFLFSRGISTLSQWFVDTLATLPSGNSPRHLIELGRQEAMGEVQSPPQVEYQRSSENWAEELQQIQRVLEQGKASEPVLLYLDEPGNGWEVNGILQSLTQYLPLSCGVLVSHTRLDTCAMQESQSVWTGAMHWFNTAGMAVGFTLLETPLWIASLWTGFQRGLTTVEFTPFDFNLREINLIAFPDWSQPEEVLDELLSSLILALLSRPDRDRITLLIDSSQANVEEADLLLSSLLMQLMLEQEIDLADLEISLTGSLQPQDWQSLLPHIHARIPLTWENPQAIVAANATILPLFS